MDNSRSKTKTLSRNSAEIIGVLGIIIPIGIQDFATRRIGCGIFHLLAALAIFPGIILLAFDGFCAGGHFCESPPGIVSWVGAFLLASGVVSVILNLVECIKLISRHEIIFTRKTSRAVIFAILFCAIAIFLVRLLIFWASHP